MAKYTNTDILKKELEESVEVVTDSWAADNWYAISASKAIALVEDASAANVVEVVRCKDCKHRPIDTGGQGDGFDIEFPDYVCPCQVEDPYYSWVPKDDWFCPNGERKDNGCEV